MLCGKEMREALKDLQSLNTELCSTCKTRANTPEILALVEKNAVFATLEVA